MKWASRLFPNTAPSQSEIQSTTADIANLPLLGLVPAWGAVSYGNARRAGSLAGRRTARRQRTEYHLSNLPATANFKMLAAAIKAQWICKQEQQQFKEELGFDHFEGRSSPFAFAQEA